MLFRSESHQESLLPGDNLYIIVGDASNANYKWCFSTTPDGTHNGGVEYTTNVTRVGTPGDGSNTTFLKLDIDITIKPWTNILQRVLLNLKRYFLRQLNKQSL